MLWLKRCVVPSLPKDTIAINVVYPAVLLAYRRPFGLLPAMVSNLQTGLRALSIGFLSKDKANGKDEGIHKSDDTESPCGVTLYLFNGMAHHALFLIDDRHKLLSNG